MKGFALKLLLICLGVGGPSWAVYHYIIRPTTPPISVSKVSLPQTSAFSSPPTVLPKQTAAFSTVVSAPSLTEGKVLRKESISKVEKTDSSREITAERRDPPPPPPLFSMGPAFQSSSLGQFFPSPSFGGTVPQSSPLGIPRAGGEIPSTPFSPPTTISSPSFSSPVAPSSPQTGIPGVGAGASTSPLISKTGGNNSSIVPQGGGSQGNQIVPSPPSPSPIAVGSSLGSGPPSDSSNKSNSSGGPSSSSGQIALVASSDGPPGQGTAAREKKSGKSNQGSGTGAQPSGTNVDGSGGGAPPAGGQNPPPNPTADSGTNTGGTSTGGSQTQSLQTGTGGTGSKTGIHVTSLMLNLGDPSEPTYSTNDNSSSTTVASNTSGQTDSPGGIGRQDHGVDTDFTVHAHVSVAPPGQTICGDTFKGGVPTVNVTYSPDNQTNQFPTNKGGIVGIDLNKEDRWVSAEFSVSYTDGNGTVYNGRLSPDGRERTKVVYSSDVDPKFCFYLVSMPNLKKVVTGMASDSTTQDQEAVHLIPRN